MATKSKKDYDREWLAWAAGIIDGEGCIRTQIRETRPGHTIRGISVSVAQCNPDMGAKLTQVTGLGQVYKRAKPKNPKHSQRWDYRISGYERVQAFVALIWPWLGEVKRAQAKVALQTFRADRRTGDYGF